MKQPEPSEFLLLPFREFDLFVVYRAADISRPFYVNYTEFIKVITASITPTSGLLLQTNGVNNPTQDLLNLIGGTNVTIADDGAGNVTISATGSGGANARNGLILNSGYVELGGATLGTGNLIRNTYITNDGFLLRIDQTTGIGLDVRNALGTAVQAITSNGFGLRARADSGIAVEALSYDNVAGLFQLENPDTSTILPVIKVQRNSTGTVFNGMGAAIDIWLEPRITVPVPSPTVPTGSFQVEWLVSGSTVLSRRGQFNITLDKGDVQTRVMHGNANGEIFLDDYGTGSHIDTPTYALGVNASNKIVEFAVPSGGGTVTSVGLALNPAPSSPAIQINNSPITTSGDLEIEFLGSTSQYVRGDGSLAKSHEIPSTVVGIFKMFRGTQGFEIIPSTGQLWIAAPVDGRVDIYDASTGYYIGGFLVTGAFGVIYVASLDEVWITSSSSTTIERYDPATFTSLGSFTSGGNGGLSYVEVSSTKLYICNVNSNSVSDVDPSTLTVTTTILAGTMGMTTCNDIAYVDNPSSNHHQYLAVVSTGASEFAAIDTTTNTVAILGTNAGSTIVTPYSIAYNPVNDRYYISSTFGDFALGIFEPDSTTTIVRENFLISRLQRGIACDQTTGKVYATGLLATSVIAVPITIQCFNTSGIEWSTVTLSGNANASTFDSRIKLDTVNGFLYVNGNTATATPQAITKIKI